jgi:hypothetical protein
MTGWARAAALLGPVLALVTVLPAASAQDLGRVEGRVLFSFTDREIHESSGLVDGGDVVHTVNDSGSGPVLYSVDPAGGDTVDVTTYSDDEVEDVEALAPGRGGTVWVGDIGDNFEQRDEVWVHRVRPGASGNGRFGLRYPDGAHDAETLLAHPRTGQLFVVSKTVFGGVVYAAPRRLVPGDVHRMRPFAQVPGLLTDGAFLPDGEHVLLRGYASAAVYTFPAFEELGRFDLPPQRQGEGLSVGRGGRVLLSSEGVGSEVLEVDLPEQLVRAMTEEPSATTAPSPRPESTPTPGPEQAAPNPSSADWPWGWIAGGAMALGLLGVVLLLLRQRRDLR